MKNTEFVNRVLEIAATNPTYRTGGDGSDGTCDCIGLIMGAIGKKYDMHSTNYFARYQMTDMRSITEDVEPELGELVYKARSASNPLYDLHERYKQSGRYYMPGDMLDYYHVGVVTGVNPLVITHCTESAQANGIARDYTIVGWTHIGAADDVEYEELVDIPADVPVPDLAVVYSDNQEPVRLRSAPSTDKGYNTVAKVPFGAEVVVLERSSDWATVQWNSMRGYMQIQYLRLIGMAPEDQETGQTEERMVTITLPERVAEELRLALRFLD